MSRPASSLPPPSKKRKVQKDSEFGQSIQRLEEQLTAAAASNSSLNPLADLLELAFTAGDAQDTSKAIYSLYRIFVILISGGKLGTGGDEAAKVVKAWIWDRLNSYVDFLCGLLKDEEKLLRISALQILFSLQKHLSTAASLSESQPQFHGSHFRRVVSALLFCPPSRRSAQGNSGVLDADVLQLFHETWFSVHDDVRWFFLREAGTLITTASISEHPHLPANLLAILEGLNTFPTEKEELNAWWVSELGAKPPKPKPSRKVSASADDSSDEEPDKEGEDADDDWRKFFDEDTTTAEKTKKPGARLHKLTIHQSLHSLPSHRAVFTRAWLALLPKVSAVRDVEKSKSLSSRALGVMHRGVMPHLTRPVLIMDWVGGCVDIGGSIGLLALNALFVLMKEYNLDYPSFYTKLYAFLDRDVLHSKHRARFFRLTELFLSSTHLPATLLASFIKRLARLSLSAPPSAVIMIIPFTYNTLKRHPALMAMIHRPADDTASSDPFDIAEPNPLLTKAIESSLWELNSHREHYLAGVSTLTKIFAEAFTKPSYAMEDFLDHTYGTLFDADATRKIKKEPPVAMEIGKHKDLFPREVEVLGGDVVSELWSFAC
ncbi:CBF/Mak21 family-domain-containing protein [Mycena albidolilacea]|uniref:CBF/Mak21 family-domain-containing protein n=1 Tax=Mycena albidolilacea TaxID=1033008 RepID=A0AAD7ARB9_9AGAR|nr:CBF/Mak21 family-domain-containing protein [Mycena albidolilacea]